MMAAGVPHDEVQKRIEWPNGHAVLGDGPVYLVLRKTYATLYRGPEAQELPIGRDDYDADEVRRTVELDGCKVELIYTLEDNYYVYARLTQPDGNVWHGWSLSRFFSSTTKQEKQQASKRTKLTNSLK